MLVLTGDRTLPDPTKWGGGYTEHDLWLHSRMHEALGRLEPWTFEHFGDHARLIERLADGNRPAFVLNFCDTGFRNVASHELHVAALLEALDVAYSGAPPSCMVLCYDKPVVRLLARELGVPTPHELYFAPDAPWDLLHGATYPALIKPAQGDGSVGIDRHTLVHSPVDARKRIERFREELRGRAALVQEYLPGPEYGLALVGNPGLGLRALPLLEIDFRALPAELPPILPFESKTGPANPFSAVRFRPAELAPMLGARLRQDAEKLFTRLGCRDYARFDFRTGADGVIKLLEVNPNPAWDV